MRYHNITHDDMLNGDGLRVVLWVAGCEHCCKGCQNPQTWDAEGGLPFDEAAKQEIFDQLLADGIITQEVYDAIAAWMQAKAPQAQQSGTAPAEGSEPPALPDGTAPAEGSEPPALPEGAPDNTAALQLLKELLDNGTITQEQYDLLAGGVQVPPAAVPET